MSYLLSIAIPSYERTQELLQTVNNIIHLMNKLELYDEIEICISDNGSSINKREVVTELSKKNSFINVNFNDVNLGFDENCKRVIEMANGRYIWLFSDDDLITDHGLEIVIKQLRNVVSINAYIVNNDIIENGVRRYINNFLGSELIFEKKIFNKFAMKMGNRIGFMSSIILNSEVKEFIYSVPSEIANLKFYHLSLLLTYLNLKQSWKVKYLDDQIILAGVDKKSTDCKWIQERLYIDAFMYKKIFLYFFSNNKELLNCFMRSICMHVTNKIVKSKIFCANKCRNQILKQIKLEYFRFPAVYLNIYPYLFTPAVIFRAIYKIKKFVNRMKFF